MSKFVVMDLIPGLMDENTKENGKIDYLMDRELIPLLMEENT